MAPEFVKFDATRGMFNGQNHNLLRPETAESLFLLWRVTKDPIYREQGWAMFLAFDRWCRVEVSTRHLSCWWALPVCGLVSPGRQSCCCCNRFTLR